MVSRAPAVCVIAFGCAGCGQGLEDGIRVVLRQYSGLWNQQSFREKRAWWEQRSGLLLSESSQAKNILCGPGVVVPACDPGTGEEECSYVTTPSYAPLLNIGSEPKGLTRTGSLLPTNLRPNKLPAMPYFIIEGPVPHCSPGA